MTKKLTNGDVVYAGYPTVQVHDFHRNSKGKLVFSKVKELLWGDWITVKPYDYRQSTKSDIKTSSERSFVDTKISEIQNMVQVRVRGRSGYMHRQDLEDNRLLEVVFVDVGQGDGALMITPDDKKYVIDAGVGDSMYRYLKWRFAGFNKAHTDFDGLIITHPDLDHYNGFNLIIEDEEVQANNIWHNGLMEQFNVDTTGNQPKKAVSSLGHSTINNGQRYIDDLMETDKNISEFLKNEHRWIKQSKNGRAKKFPELINKAFTAKSKRGRRRFPNISMLSTAHGASHGGKFYLPGFTPSNKDNCVVEIVGPVVQPDVAGNKRLRVFGNKPKKNEKTMNTGKTKNGHSVLFKLTYKNMTLFFGGDLNSPAEMFLLDQTTDKDVYKEIKTNPKSVVEAAQKTFRCDAKSCHHGSADFTNSFLDAMNAVATVISSGDNESHAHPRSDTLGAIGHFGRGQRSLIFSTEIARSTSEYTKKENSPWGQAMILEVKAEKETDPTKKAKLLDKAKALFEKDKKLNVTVYGAINLRSNGEKVVLAYMLEKPSETNKWDVYTLETGADGNLQYRPTDSNSVAAKKRLKIFNDK